MSSLTINFFYQIRKSLRNGQHFEKPALRNTVYFEPFLDPETDSLLGNHFAGKRLNCVTYKIIKQIQGG